MNGQDISSFAVVDLDQQPPRIDFPEPYNAVCDLVDRHIVQGRATKIALIDKNGSYAYGEIAARVNRVANVMQELGLKCGDRIILCLLDTVDFPTLFLGALRAGVIPVPINPLLPRQDFADILNDSGARIAFVGADFLSTFEPEFSGPRKDDLIVTGGGGAPGEHRQLSALMAVASESAQTAGSTHDSVAFWLYTSGSTGQPKGVMHSHGDLIASAALAGLALFRVTPDDILYSASKLFFAYGLGSSLSVPFYCGAKVILNDERPKPDRVLACVETYRPTIFFAVPTLIGNLLADQACRTSQAFRSLRFCVSAGEPLPSGMGMEWKGIYGSDVVDGMGSTEMLYQFLSNDPAAVRYGVTGRPVPGYELKLLDDSGREVGPGEVGQLWVKGPSRASAYWQRDELSRNTFQGDWMHTEDQFLLTEDGYYVFQGRADDMLKVDGMYVSPIEVESALLQHDAVQEAAVVGKADDAGMVQPIAYIVLHSGARKTNALAEELQQFVKSRLARFKFPRRIEFVGSLPKTATGKIQRSKLREKLAAGPVDPDARTQD